MVCVAGGQKTGGALTRRQCVRQHMFIFNFFVFTIMHTAKPSCEEKNLYANVNVDENSLELPRVIQVRNTLYSSLGIYIALFHV